MKIISASGICKTLYVMHGATFVQFKKREKAPMAECCRLKAKLYKWYKIAQYITYHNGNCILLFGKRKLQSFQISLTLK